MGEAPSTRWRGIDELARLVGWFAWTEHRIFEVTGEWATAPGDEVAGGAAAEVRVWCAASSRRHGALAAAWATHLPVRAGVDAAAFVVPPPGPLAEAFEALAALPAAGGGMALLVDAVLPGLDGVYARYLAGASPVSEGPVVEELVRAREALAGEAAAAHTLLLQGMHEGFSANPLLASPFEQAFEEFCVFPAVRPS